MKDLIIESTTLQNSVEMLSQFFQVLSDGYNPATLDLRIMIGQNYNERMIFELNSQYASNEKYVKRVLETKLDVYDVSSYLRNSFQQSLDHLMAFTVTPELFKSQFHLENLKKIVSDVVDKILLFIRNFVFSYQALTYKISYEEELLLIHASDQCMLIKFGNYIH